MKPPLVSVIVPTYNRPDSLPDTLQSINAQTYAPIEVIVVNDGGVDVEPLVARVSSRCRISYLSHSTNRGLSAARNTGIKAANGAYIGYLDDDDLFYPEHIQTLLTFLENARSRVAYTDALRAFQERSRGLLLNVGRIIRMDSSRMALVYLLSRLAHQDRRPLKELAMGYMAANAVPYNVLEKAGLDLFSRAASRYLVVKRDLPYSFDFDPGTLLLRNFVPVLCFMHHVSCLEVTGLFDETLTSHEDWDMWIRMSRRYKFSHIKKITGEYSWRTDGSTMTSRMKADFKRTAALVSSRYRREAAIVVDGGRPKTAPLALD